MNFKPVQYLTVYRTLASGQRVLVGELAQNRSGVYFQYDTEYLEQYNSLSPFTLAFNSSLHKAPLQPHMGIHGVFADSLPDGWGMLLQDRVFRRQSILANQVTAMDRLAFVGQSSIGALSFEPKSDYVDTLTEAIDIAELGIQAQAVFDGQTDEVLAALVAAGSSGGARPKAQIYCSKNGMQQCKTVPAPEDEAWIVKFTSQHLPLGHEEGLCEAAYLTLAKQAELQPPNWQLLDAPVASGAEKWLAIERFDYLNGGGRLHMISACGLLDADYRTPSLDYVDLIKASRQLCHSPAVGRLQFKRAIFNLLALNQDDHSKNWAFLQSDDGTWQPAPFYDVTFSPHPFGEHATAFAGYGKQVPLAALKKLATHAGFKNWKQAQAEIENTLAVLSAFSDVALELGVNEQTVQMIDKHIQQQCGYYGALLN